MTGKSKREKEGLVMLKRVSLLLILGVLTVLNGCMSIHEEAGDHPTLVSNTKWTVVPFANQTETPYAGSRAAAITSALLDTHGVHRIVYRTKSNHAKAGIAEQLEPVNLRESIGWARRNQIRYLVTGQVTEWRYKVGLDGEPAVGVTLQLIDTNTGKTLWNAVSSGIGGSRDSLAIVAQHVINRALKDLHINRMNSHSHYYHRPYAYQHMHH